MFQDEYQKGTNEACASIMCGIVSLSQIVLGFVKRRQDVN
jgi:hypothetical protein